MKIDLHKDIEEAHQKKYHRGMSWEHCYTYFRNYKNIINNENLLDTASLHLGFFMASWGMLRGSSFLLERDYKFYTPIVKCLLNSKYYKLWEIDFLNNFDDKSVDLLFELKDDLQIVINENNRLVDDKEDHELELIITKIIMGTMGCIPAYDRFYKDGFKKYFNVNVNFYRKSFINMIDLINKDESLKKVVQDEIQLKNSNYYYPKMKLIDLLFWKIGKGD